MAVRISASDRTAALAAGKDGTITPAEATKLQAAGFTAAEVKQLKTQAADGGALTRTELTQAVPAAGSAAQRDAQAGAATPEPAATAAARAATPAPAAGAAATPATATTAPDAAAANKAAIAKSEQRQQELRNQLASTTISAEKRATLKKQLAAEQKNEQALRAAKPAVPATPATPAAPSGSGAAGSPATPATPAVPAVPSTTRSASVWNAMFSYANGRGYAPAAARSDEEPVTYAWTGMFDNAKVEPYRPTFAWDGMYDTPASSSQWDEASWYGTMTSLLSTLETLQQQRASAVEAAQEKEVATKSAATWNQFFVRAGFGRL